jgi:hypothetical protein
MPATGTDPRSWVSVAKIVAGRTTEITGTTEKSTALFGSASSVFSVVTSNSGAGGRVM